MSHMQQPGCKIREIDPQSQAEISLVAQRMRQTLIEVLGEEKGTAMYTMDWLTERVRWHLDPKRRVFLSENEARQITGHAIARIESGDDGILLGYFSTVFVALDSRRQGIAGTLLRHVESWFLENGIPKIVYNTAKNHSAIIALFSAHGYRITYSEFEMIQLTKVLSGS